MRLALHARFFYIGLHLIIPQKMEAFHGEDP